MAVLEGKAFGISATPLLHKRKWCRMLALGLELSWLAVGKQGMMVSIRKPGRRGIRRSPKLKITSFKSYLSLHPLSDQPWNSV